MVRAVENYSRISTRGEKLTDVKWWDFTQSCEKMKVSEDELMAFLDDMCEKWCYGHETGQDGYKHLQGRVVWKKAKELATIKNQTKNVLPSAHWSKTSHDGHNFDYTQKEGNYICSWEGAIRQFAGLKLNDWQAQAQEFWHNQTERQVHVIIGQGNDGKSWFSKYMEATHQADVCPVTDGEASNYIEYCMNHPNKGYIFDVPRSDTIKGKKNMWKAIEQIKNGLLYDRRYTSRKMWIQPPRVLVFANELPDEDALTSDRWIVHEIDPTYKILMPARGWNE